MKTFTPTPIFYIIALIIYSAVFLYSCRKDQHPDLSINTEAEVYKSWLKQNGGYFQDGIINLGDKSGKSLYRLDWKEGRSFIYNNIHYFYVPLSSPALKPKIEANNDSLDLIPGMVFRKLNSGEIQAAFRQSISIHDSTDANNKNNQIKSQAILYTLISGQKSTLWIKNDNQVLKANWVNENGLNKFNSNSESASLGGGCQIIEVSYWTLAGSYSTADGGVVVEAYLTTSYIVSCNYSSLDPGNSSGGDGNNDWPPTSGSGGDGNNNDCMNNWNKEWNQLISPTVVAGEPNFTISSISPLRKYKNPRWEILRNLTWSLYSQETGIVKLVDANADKWEWESLTHGNIAVSGITIGGTVSPDQGIGSPSFTPGTSNVLYAGMTLDYNVTYTPLCNCVIGKILPSWTTHYTSHSGFWSAHP